MTTSLRFFHAFDIFSIRLHSGSHNLCDSSTRYIYFFELLHKFNRAYKIRTPELPVTVVSSVIKVEPREGGAAMRSYPGFVTMHEYRRDSGNIP